MMSKIVGLVLLLSTITLSEAAEKEFKKAEQCNNIVDGIHDGEPFDDFSVETKEECCGACAENAECLSWSFQSWIDHGGEVGVNCELFNTPLDHENLFFIPELVYGDANDHSNGKKKWGKFVKKRQTKCETNVGFILQDEMDFFGGGYSKAECCRACSETEGCESWTFTRFIEEGEELSDCQLFEEPSFGQFEQLLEMVSADSPHKKHKKLN
eukprot:124768_1